MADNNKLVPIAKAKSAKGRKKDQPDQEDLALDKGNQLLKTLEKKQIEDIVMTDGVPQSVYLGWIKRELASESACLELPLTIVMLISFLILALWLLNQNQIFAVEEAVANDIAENANFAWAHNFGHKAINDVNSIADFWSWIRLGYLPLIVQPTWPYSENYPPSLGNPVYHGHNYSKDDNHRPTGPGYWMLEGYERPTPHRNDYLRYNRIVSGILLRQWVADTGSCNFPVSLDASTLKAWLGKPCMPTSLGLGVLTPELRDVEIFDYATREQFLLPEIDNITELTRTLVDMEDGCTHAASRGDISKCRCDSCKTQNGRQPWLDEQTTRAELSFIMFNPVYGMYTYVGTNFLFNRGGHIYKHINCMSVWADPMAKPFLEMLPTFIAGAIWGSTLLYVVMGETKEIVAVVRGSSERCTKALWDDYLSFWNGIDWVSILIGAVVVALFLRMRGYVDVSNAAFKDMAEMSVDLISANMDIADSATRLAYQEKASAFFKSIETSVLAEKNFRTLLAVYPNMLMLRLFKSFDAQPRLAVITATLMRASQDLFHFFIVFFSVYLCMVVNSILLFGQDLEDFCTLPRAINTCFRAMFGDWNWTKMKEIGLLKAQIWFWVFLLVMVLILLSMLVAIFMDAYTAVKEKAVAAYSLAEQIDDMRRRRNQYRRGERVRLNDIWDVFAKEYDFDEKKMLSDPRPITVDLLLSNVPRLQFAQAKRTLKNSMVSEQKRNAGELEPEKVIEDIRKTIETVERRAENIVEDLSFAVDRTRYYDRCQASGDPEFEFHFGGEGQSATQQTQEAVNHAVTGLSNDICGLFEENLRHIEDRQGSFERQQNELHGLIAEMQMMVRQQAWAVNAIQEAVTQVGGTFDEPVITEEETHGS